MPEKVSISVVLPVFNEEGNLAALVDEIRAALRPVNLPWEILVVDDASTDGSLGVARELMAKGSDIRLIRHRPNCGQSAAVATGFEFARGDVVITLDSDGQNDPADIPKYIAALQADVDCVCGIRAKRRDTGVKRIASKVANRFRNWITSETIRDAGCGFRAVRRHALTEVPVFNGMHRFLPTLLRAQGFNVVEIPINHRPRQHGVSKYGIGDRLWRGIRDCFGVRWYQHRAVLGRRAAEETRPPTPDESGVRHG